MISSRIAKLSLEATQLAARLSAPPLGKRSINIASDGIRCYADPCAFFDPAIAQV